MGSSAMAKCIQKKNMIIMKKCFLVNQIDDLPSSNNRSLVVGIKQSDSCDGLLEKPRKHMSGTGNDLLCKVHNPLKRLFGHEKNRQLANYRSRYRFF